MKIGTSTIRRVGLGAAAILGGFLGLNSLSQRPDRSGPPPALLDESQDWGSVEHQAMRTSWGVGAVEYSANLVAPVYDIRDFGAVAGDDKNDAQAIRAAIAAHKLADLGGTVYIPEGEWLIWPDAVVNPGANSYPPGVALHHSPLIIEGAGPTLTTLNYRTPGGGDPNDDQLYRGAMFTTLNTPESLDGITLRGFRATGNAQVTELAGIYTDVGSLRGWDTTHKFLSVFGGVGITVNNIVCEFIEADHWRGEIFYAGGNEELFNMTVRDCIVRRSNASAISMGGFVTVDRCWVKSVYNGTECFSLADHQGLVVRNTVMNVNDDLPPGVPNIGKFGVVYLGVQAAELEVDNCDIGKTVSGGIFLSEAASNVTINNNRFTDTLGVTMTNNSQYQDEPDFQYPEPNSWINHVYSNNTFTALTADVPTAIFSQALPGVNWTFSDNTLVDTGEFQFSSFVNTSGATGDYIFTGNTVGGVAQPVIPYGASPYPTVWTGNTITGTSQFGIPIFNGDTDGSILDLNPYWPRVQIASLNDLQKRIRIPASIVSVLPTGYQVELRNTSTLFGADVCPDPAWNNLTRGYMLYAGAVLTLSKSATGGMDFVSYTPPTINVATQTQSGPIGFNLSQIKVAGQGEINLAPSVAHTFDSWAGVAIGETVTLDYNANVTLDHVAGVMETTTGTDFVPGTTGTISATRANDGALLIGTHTVTEDSPLIGAVQSGDPTDNVYQVTVTIVQDGDHPSAVDGYYSLERKEGAGAWGEIEQIVKGDFTGTRKAYVYTDTTTERGTAYTYRARAVSPGTPDVVSRWSNSAEVTLSNYTGALTVLTEVYKTASAQDLEIDIYRPNDALTNRTAVICVHGGGWTSSSRAVHAAHCVHFAAEGVVAFNIDYRLDDGTVDMEDQVQDVRAAIRWVRENAATYGVDPDDIVILGESAGGHLAGVAAFVDAFDDAGGNQAVSSRPDRAILINPITYLPGWTPYTASGYPPQVGAFPVPNDTTQLTPASTGADLSLRLSPQLYTNITPAPPVLFIHGDSDSVVPFEQSEDMHDLLVLAGNTSTLETMVGSNHSFFLPGTGSTAEINATLALIDAFLAAP